jgi:hypothetical protein
MSVLKTLSGGKSEQLVPGRGSADADIGAVTKEPARHRVAVKRASARSTVVAPGVHT